MVTSLLEAGLAIDAVAGLATLDIKSDEISLVKLGKEKDWPIRFFSAEELSKVDVPNPSLVVDNEVGTPSVAEAAALLAAGKSGLLLTSKKVYYANDTEQGAATIAIVESNIPFAPQLGELHLIGSGPGDLSLLTFDARAALSKSAVWCGYGLYLDLLEPLRRKDQVCFPGKLTREKERCINALDLAKQGVCVSLISSGDSGIYGMAGIALELLLNLPETQRPKFEVHPGISAFQLASARLGAAMMTDFCVISLSDLLTPWLIIEKRLRAASTGDFVVGLYNPRSKGRHWQLKRAIEIFLENCLAETPVAIARQLGRVEEKVTLHTLDTVPIDKVDMFSLVLIGNSRSFANGDWFVTPRGYTI